MRNDLPPELEQQRPEADALRRPPPEGVGRLGSGPSSTQEEMERNAYNAAFYELGLHWHWDSQTYSALMRFSPEPETRIRRYLETEHPHLLQAYDPGFLAAAIHERKRDHKPCPGRSFDWAHAATWWELGGA